MRLPAERIAFPPVTRDPRVPLCAKRSRVSIHRPNDRDLAVHVTRGGGGELDNTVS